MKKPNVLIIHADQHRQDCIGAYGNSQIKTPNIDKLAKEGVLYNNHFCVYPVSTPSRYSFLTGLYAHQHLGWSNHCTLPNGIETFPSVLRDNGYRTKAVGKMHFTPTYLDVGFEEMVLCEQDGPGRFDDDYHRYLKDEGLIDDIDIIDQRQEYREHASREYWDNFGALESNLDKEHHSTTWITHQAIEEIRGWDEEQENNLLMIGYVKPHHPFDPPHPYSEMYDPDSLDILPGFTDEVPTVDYKKGAGYFNNQELTEDKLKYIMAMYYGTISQIDDDVGRIIQLLKDKDLYDNTLIIYTSDHGEYMGFHHMLLKSNYMYDPLVKIPLIIKYPGNHNKKTSEDNLSSNIDMARTILKTCHIAVPNHMSSYDLSDKDKARQMVVSEQLNGDTYDYMVRSSHYKLFFGQNGRDLKFYDLVNDPFELEDISKDEGVQDEIQRHKDYLYKTMLFESQSVTHLDYNAPVSSSAPDDISKNRKEMEDYFQGKSSVAPHFK